MVRKPHITARALSAALLLVAALLVAGCSQTNESDAPAEPAESDSSPTASAETSPAEEGSSAGNGNADVTYVKAAQASDGTWSFEVTVAHPDTGWEDYADGWDVVTPDGEVLKADPADPFTRPLAHPHVDEQPFTRSQSGIEVPDGVTVVVVRAHDIVDGFGGKEIHVHLEAVSGEGFEITR
jgi:hypothetical protein